VIDWPAIWNRVWNGTAQLTGSDFESVLAGWAANINGGEMASIPAAWPEF